MLVATVNLVDVVDGAGALGGEGGDEQGDTGTDVGGRHGGRPKLCLVILPDDGGAVGVAENDFGPHVKDGSRTSSGG